MKRFMTGFSEFFGLHFKPKLVWAILLGAIPIVLLCWSYASESAARKAHNKDDRVFPTVSEMYEQTRIYVSEPDIRTDTPLFWHDLKYSMKLLVMGLSISAITAFIFGILMGVFPWFRALNMPIVTVISIIPALTILAILFCVFGIGDTAKVALIVIGTSFLMMRDTVAYIRGLPEEQMVKTLTLGRGSFAFVTRVVMPQVAPRFLEMLRLNYSPAWLFLIASEGLAADSGLAHRMYLAQRTNHMALVIPIVFAITMIAVAMNYGTLFLNKKCFKYFWLGGK